MLKSEMPPALKKYNKQTSF